MITLSFRARNYMQYKLIKYAFGLLKMCKNMQLKMRKNMTLWYNCMVINNQKIVFFPPVIKTVLNRKFFDILYCLSFALILCIFGILNDKSQN